MLGKARKPSTPTNCRITVRLGSGISIDIDPNEDLDLDDYSYYIPRIPAARLTRAWPRQHAWREIKSTSYLWAEATAGTCTAFVVAHDTSDQINGGSLPATSTFTLGAPNPPVRLSDSQIGGIWRIEMPKPTTLGVVGIEIRAHYCPQRLPGRYCG